jgi:zinc protease
MGDQKWINGAILLATLLGAGQAGVSVQASGAEKVTEIEGISEYRLDNGTRVLLFPDPSQEVVTVNMTVFVGSRHEGYGEAGMAHLLEHMLFKGTPTHPDVPQILNEKAGAGNFNGTTWVDRTNYYEKLPASDESLEWAIRFEADRLVNSFVRGEDLASEMTVVRNEFERGENDPISILLQRMTAAAYEWHNYGKNTIGNRSDIERVPVVRLRNFYRKFYRPDNVMLIVAGKFEPDKALAYAEKYFGALPRPETPIDNTYTIEPPQDGERQVVLRRVGTTQLVGACYHVPAGSHPDFAAMRIVARVLGAEGSGRLYQRLVEPGVASFAAAFARAYHDPGLLTALAQLPENGSREEARELLLTTIEDDLRENPITERELQRARSQILKQRELEASSSERLAISLSDWAAQGDWRLYFLYRDRIESLTREEVQAAAERYLVRANRTLGMFIPSEEPRRVEIPAAPDLNELFADYRGREGVSQGEAFDPSYANIEQRTERGSWPMGIKYALLPKQTRGETVQLRMTLRYGDLESLRGRGPAAELLPALMQRGTTELDYVALRDELDRLRTELSIGGLPGVLQVTLKTQQQYLPEVLDLLEQILRAPRLSAEQLEIVRRQSVAALEQQLNDPQALAIARTRQQFAPYPPDDVRYEPLPDEQLTRVRGVTIEQVRELYERFLGAQAGELAVVGAFDPQTIKPRLREMLTDWPAEVPFVRVPRPAHADVAGGLREIETPDKENAFYFAAEQFEISDADKDYAELLLANYILGGGSLSSRLGDRIRQQEAISYGVGSAVNASAQDERAELFLYASANPREKTRLIELIDEELRRFVAEGVTREELERAKESYLQQQAVQRTRDPQLTSLLVTTLFNDRTMDFYIEREQEIEAATVAELNRVIAEFVDPDRLVATIAGDFRRAAESDRSEGDE